VHRHPGVAPISDNRIVAFRSRRARCSRSSLLALANRQTSCRSRRSLIGGNAEKLDGQSRFLVMTTQALSSHFGDDRLDITDILMMLPMVFPQL